VISEEIRPISEEQGTKGREIMKLANRTKLALAILAGFSVAVNACNGTAAWPRHRVWTEQESGPGNAEADTTGTPLRMAERET